MSRGTIWTVVVVTILAGVIFAGVGAQSDTATVTGEAAESHTLNETEPTTLEQADVWRDLIEHSVTDQQTGDELVEGDDYTLNETTGDLLGSTDTDGTVVDVSYRYTYVDADTETIAGLLAPVGPLLGWFVVFAVVGTLLGYIVLLPKGGGSW